jgi:hypothetical protein
VSSPVQAQAEACGYRTTERRFYIFMVLGDPKAHERLVPKLRLGTHD